jgi:hypothetical protein
MLKIHALTDAIGQLLAILFVENAELPRGRHKVTIQIADNMDRVGVKSVRLLELARNAQRLFEKQEPREKRRLLNFVVSNCAWKGGELIVNLRQPFDLLAETAAIAAQAAADRRHNLAKNEIWLPGPECPKPVPSVA